jgi:intron-binding protein aquarius
LEVLPPKVGEEKPAAIRAEVNLELSRVSSDVRREWESLRTADMVFLLGAKGIDDGDKLMINGGSEKLSIAEKYGIKCLRAAEVVQVLDAHGRQLGQDHRGAHTHFRLHLKLDADMYKVCYLVRTAADGDC